MFTKEQMKKIIDNLIKDNEPNFEEIDTYENRSYARGYAEGIHDGLLDVLNQLKIETDEEYYN